jgi:hypothetical protein
MIEHYFSRMSVVARCRLGPLAPSYSQKTQTHHFHSVYGLTVARSSSCNPSRYSPYSLPLRDHERLWWYDLWTGSNY